MAAQDRTLGVHPKLEWFRCVTARQFTVMWCVVWPGSFTQPLLTKQTRPSRMVSRCHYKHPMKCRACPRAKLPLHHLTLLSSKGLPVEWQRDCPHRNQPSWGPKMFAHLKPQVHQNLFLTREATLGLQRVVTEEQQAFALKPFLLHLPIFRLCIPFLWIMVLWSWVWVENWYPVTVIPNPSMVVLLLLHHLRKYATCRH